MGLYDRRDRPAQLLASTSPDAIPRAWCFTWFLSIPIIGCLLMRLLDKKPTEPRRRDDASSAMKGLVSIL